MVSIGYFVTPLDSIEGQIPTYMRDNHRVADALIKQGFDVEKFDCVDDAREYDCVVLSESWAYHGHKTGEVFQKWCDGKISFDVPVVVNLIHIRESYDNRDYQTGMMDKADGFIVMADYDGNIDKPTETLKFGTYRISEELESLEKDDVIRAPMGRVGVEDERLEAVLNCPLDLTLYGKSKGGNTSYEGDVDFPSNIDYVGRFVSGMDIFKDSKFIFEAKRNIWLQPSENPQPYWSDRVGHAVSYGAHLITNYEPALEQWESTISYEEAYNDGLEYDLKSIKRDREKWLYSNRVDRLKNLFERVVND